jgi:hypothetical protein
MIVKTQLIPSRSNNGAETIDLNRSNLGYDFMWSGRRSGLRLIEAIVSSILLVTLCYSVITLSPQL